MFRLAQNLSQRFGQLSLEQRLAVKVSDSWQEARRKEDEERAQPSSEILAAAGWFKHCSSSCRLEVGAQMCSNRLWVLAGKLSFRELRS